MAAPNRSVAPVAMIPITIVQSVPEGSRLDQPGMPYAKATWIHMIGTARETIDIEQMYVSGDQGKARDMNDVVRAMDAAAKRGVKIRLLLATRMLDTDPVLLKRLQAIPNLQIAAVDYGKLTGGIQHAKFWIVDSRDTFIGSQNFDYLALTQIHEVGVRILDPNVANRLQSVFDLDWNMATTGRIPPNLGVAPVMSRGTDVDIFSSPARLNPKNIRAALPELKRLLDHAKKTVRIQVMEYSTFSGPSPWNGIDDSLRAAAHRGVKIEFVVSHWNTARPAIDSIKRLSLEPNISVRIATVPDLPSGHIPFSRVTHSKYMVIDDEVLWVGTSNWSRGYFEATRGIEVVMYRRELAAAATRMFSTLWTAPFTVPVDVNRDYPKPTK